MIKVAINGYGTIGKRVADAVSKQKDMQIVGVVKRTPDYVSRIAADKHKLYVSEESGLKAFEESGIKVHGTVGDLLDDCDIVVDSTPEGMGDKNKELYKKHHVKAIFQGGEKPTVGEASFNAYANFEEARGKEFVRVVSCNTTALMRSLFPIYSELGIRKVNVTLVRRGTDPNDHKKGPMNAIEPSFSFPSHHASDAKTIIRDLNIDSMALKVPTTLMHTHVVLLDLEKEASSNDVLDIWGRYNRIKLFNSKDGYKSTAQIMDFARELGRDRSDLFELAIWKDSAHVNSSTLSYIQAVHQESIVVPENVDAIRAMTSETGKEESIKMTDSTLGIA
jgi:glyceraldehyde-3-phosphate dehydrogenase (NAD(P))